MISAEDFLRLAGRLVAMPSADEAQFRTAISRAYYAAFHLATSYLAGTGLRIGHSHGEVQRFLAQSGHGRAIEAGKRLTDLHSFRVKADYDLANEIVGTRQFAQDCVELASDVRSILRELDVEAERLKVKAGIEAYRKRLGR